MIRLSSPYSPYPDPFQSRASPPCPSSFREGSAYELIPHHEWVRDHSVFSVLKKLVMFKKRALFEVRVKREREAGGGGAVEKMKNAR